MAHGSEAHWNTVVGQHVLAGNLPLSDFIRSV
jgi:hypothetical protein